MQKTWKLISLTQIALGIMLASFATPGLAQSNSLNFISELHGEVWIKRTGRNNAQRARMGNLLNPSDRLRLGQGASAKVFCNNLSTWHLRTPGEFSVSSGCPSARAILRDEDEPPRAPTRNANDPTIPYVISPRNTAVLTLQPTLRWNPVEGATSYQVRVRGPGVNWTKTVDCSEVVYSGESSLKPGVRYWVIVTADTGASSESEPPVGFTVLSEEEVQHVTADMTQIQQQLLSTPSKTLALAYLYRSNNLNAEAIALLEDAVETGEQMAAIYHLLGNLYQQIGLERLATERYLTALELAKAEENLEAQAEIQESLGDAGVALDQIAQAVEWFQAAQTIYRDLGDEARVEELQGKLDDLNGRVAP
jgi:hypothetical protein